MIAPGGQVPGAPAGFTFVSGAGSSQEAQNFIREVLEGNHHNVTWHKKLEMCKNLMYKYKDDLNSFSTFRTEGLALISAYLYFINTG